MTTWDAELVDHTSREFLRGYDDASMGREPSPPDDVVGRACYFEGYLTGHCEKEYDDGL